MSNGRTIRGHILAFIFGILIGYFVLIPLLNEIKERQHEKAVKETKEEIQQLRNSKK